MKIYVSVFSIPELRDLPRRERRRLWREAQPRIFLQYMVSSTLLAIPTLFGFVLIRLLQLPDNLRGLAIGCHASAVFIVSIVMFHFQIKSWRPLFKELRERDEPPPSN